MTDASPFVRSLQERVAELMGSHPLHVNLLSTGSRGSVLSCHLADGRRVIAKTYSKHTEHVRREWDALQFLALRAPTLAPRPIAQSPDGVVTIMELLHGETLDRVLERGAPATVRRPLREIARTLGQLHGTAARTTSWPASLHAAYLEQANETEKLHPKLVAALDLAEVGPAPGFDAAWSALVAQIRAPGPFLTFTHGDLAPSNVLFTEAGPTLLDFEFAGARSALYDATFWAIVVPFPRSIVREMTGVYRRALSDHLPAARDDRCFLREFGTMLTHRLYWWLSFRIEEALTSDRGDWVPGWRLRSAYLYFLRLYIATVGPLRSPTGGDALLATAERLQARLRRIWAERSIYPDHFLQARREVDG